VSLLVKGRAWSSLYALMAEELQSEMCTVQTDENREFVIDEKEFIDLANFTTRTAGPITVLCAQ
jgi:hypothetical protein